MTRPVELSWAMRLSDTYTRMAASRMLERKPKAKGTSLRLGGAGRIPRGIGRRGELGPRLDTHVGRRIQRDGNTARSRRDLARQ